MGGRCSRGWLKSIKTKEEGAREGGREGGQWEANDIIASQEGKRRRDGQEGCCSPLIAR